jgi:2,3-bisphosphoglycerate-dependent phosphoglycerate mutase
VTTLYLVRHAHADWNHDDGRPLSAGGHAAAVVLDGLLGKLPIEAIYSSPARRALQTIEPLAHRLRIQPVMVADLRERELVVASGMDFEAAIQAAWLDPGAVALGGESNAAAQARALAAIRKIFDEQNGRHTVIATHGNLLALVLNGLRPVFGFEFWRRLTFPDVYELRFQRTKLVNVRRLWHEVA